ncbi:LysM domain-containing protein [Enterococcus casseliflavus]|uniref:LysM peptidoglycan-binding domain-containing protein n=1 Tax=Enterococcus casseliflavus TaxID=37734 RepID=UPI0008ED0F6F|nr:LysM peptidoglycan-binding domain-containing protein [Enterococcus casseliflavus]SFE32226.1 LysM domain-containing protein [Enterococcus casseliflavus]
MKKISVGVIAVITIFLLAACGTRITTEDLKANDWISETSSDDDPNMLLSFSDHVMSVSIDTDSMTSNAKDDWGKLGEDLAKQIIDQMSYKLEYTLEKDTIKIQDTDDEKAFVYYTVSKEDENIIFTPDEKQNKDDSDAEKLVLKPYTKKKEVETSSSSSTEETTVSSESATTNLDDIIEAFSQQSLVVYNPRDMTKEDFGIAPMSATKAKIFSLIETDTEDEQQNARLLTFDNLDDLKATKKYYDDLGKDSAMLFSYTAVNEDELVLMQFNGQLPQELVEKYVKAASLELTESPFGSTAAESQTYSSESVAVYSEESVQPVEPPVSSQEQTYESYSAPSQPVEEYTTVQAGEGPPEIAARVGISVDQLLELNGMDSNNFMLYPGDTLRVK